MKRSVLIVFIIIFGIFLASFYFDFQIIEKVFLLRNIFLDEFFLGLTFVGSEIIIFFVLTSLFLWQEHKRKWIFPLWMSFGLSIIVSFLLKFFVQRKRPFQLDIVPILPLLEKSSHFIWNFSFPSFHAMLVFCSVPILSKEFPKFKYVWVVFAALVAFSRIYFGLHFLSDVIAGGIIGWCIGFLMIQLEKKYKTGERIYGKIFK
jgi:undecaprenyl-diphosphatase